MDETIVYAAAAIAIIALIVFGGFAYVHDSKIITISSKELLNGYGYAFTEDGEYYNVPNLGTYAKLKVGHTYAISTAIHVMGTQMNLDSAVEV